MNITSGTRAGTSTSFKEDRKRKHLVSDKGEKTKSKRRNIQKTKLSFTYFPKSESQITALKIMERPIKRNYIITIYCKGDALLFKDKGCIEKLGRKISDRITNGSSHHSCKLHKSELPRDPHVHFEMDKGDEGVFMKNLIEQHISSTSVEYFHDQFFKSVHFFTSSPQSPGVKFSDGGYSQNKECKKMNENIPLDMTGFADEKQLPDLKEIKAR